MGCMLSAASCNKWWLDDIIGTGDYAKEQEGITDVLVLYSTSAFMSDTKIDRLALAK